MFLKIMKVFADLLRNMKLQTKIAISQIIIFIIVFGLIIITFQINQVILYKIFLDSSMKMLSKQELSQLRNIQYLKLRIESTFQNTMTSLDQLNQMQRMTQSPQFIAQEPQGCLNEDFQIDSYSRGNTICYGIFNQSANKQNQQQIQQIKNSISLLTQFYQLTCLKDLQLAVVHVSELQFIALAKFVKLAKQFKPQKLPWYILHMKNLMTKKNDIYQYGFPIRSEIGDIKIRITSDLISKDLKAEGAIAREIDMSTVFNMAGDSTLYLYDLEGNVIFGKEYQAINSSFLFNLYNESVTGFNYDDWLQIKNYSIGQAYESNCSNFHKDLNILCRYNSLFKEETYIQVQQIGNAPYLIILYQNNTEFIHQEQLVRQTIKINFNSVQYAFVIITIVFAIFFAACSNAGIVIVLYQTIAAIKIMQFNTQNLQKQILSRYLLFNLTKFIVKSATGTRFSDAIRNLIIQTKARKKSEKCIEIENQKYQRKGRQYILFSNHIFKIYINKLSNYSNHNQQHSKSIILRSIEQFYKQQRKVCRI